MQDLFVQQIIAARVDAPLIWVLLIFICIEHSSAAVNSTKRRQHVFAVLRMHKVLQARFGMSIWEAPAALGLSALPSWME